MPLIREVECHPCERERAIEAEVAEALTLALRGVGTCFADWEVF